MTNAVMIRKLRRLAILLQHGTKAVDRISHYLVPAAPAGAESAESPDALVRPILLKGMWICVVLFGILGTWSALAPLKSAAVAVGSVVLDSNRKTIQHLEGGIIAEIYVHEGDMVKEGAPLVRLDDTAARARLDLYKAQDIAARALEARLMAERDNKAKIEFPADLIKEKKSNPVVQENLDSQTRLFKTHRKNLDGQLAVLQQKKEQYKEEIAGLKSQQVSATQQIKLLDEEIATVKELLKKGNAVKPRLLALQRNASALEGQRGQYISEISKAQQAIAETEITMINLKNEFLNQVVSDLKDAQVQVANLTEQIRASADMVSRINITAPIAGQVTGLKVHTIGGVIAPGEKIMDIVPQDDKLIVEVKVRVEDIDVVRPDLEAQVRLSAYRTRYVPMLQGRVVYVSGDRFTDERTGMPYYTARIEVDMNQIKDLKEVKLYPGMPTEALIVTGSRSFLSYLLNPLQMSMNRAFREQ